MFELPQDVLYTLKELSESETNSKKHQAEAYAELSKNYRDQNYQELNFSQAIAYAQARMPATYNVIRYVLEKFENKGETFSNVLDIGAGVGTLKIALQNHEIDYEAVEKSDSMRKVFKKLNNSEIKIYAEDFQKFFCEKKYQAVFASYFVNEMKDKNKALKKIFSLAEQYVFIIEPGTPNGFKNIIAAKKLANQLGWYPLLPCASLECNLKAGDWCHFSIRVPRTKLHTNLKNATLPYEDEKFCYVIFSKKESEFQNNNIIIKRPIKKSGHTVFDVCSKQGIKRIVRTDKLSKKLRWGDQITIENF